MSKRLEDAFEIVATPVSDDPEKPIYAVIPVSGYRRYGLPSKMPIAIFLFKELHSLYGFQEGTAKTVCSGQSG
jgi:hypothetical protein